MKPALLAFAFVMLAAPPAANAEFRQIDLSIFGMD